MSRMKSRRMRRLCHLVGVCVLAVFFVAAGCSRETVEEDFLSISEDEERESGADAADEKTDSEAGAEDSKEAEDDRMEEKSVVYVYVCGQVAAPGVYELPLGSRVYEAIGKAGGMLDTAAAEQLNQAAVVEDGQRLYVPTVEEAKAGGVNLDGSSSDGRVNINTAGKEELMTLSGIGESKAEAILAYREANGGFREPEELMQVDGIKEGTYNKIKDSIKVS